MICQNYEFTSIKIKIKQTIWTSADEAIQKLQIPIPVHIHSIFKLECDFINSCHSSTQGLVERAVRKMNDNRHKLLTP